jgi:hypothetical protein
VTGTESSLSFTRGKNDGANPTLLASDWFVGPPLR